MSSAEIAIRAIWAIECLSKLMDLYDEFDEEEPKMKKRKIYVKSEDVENQLLKDIAWKNTGNGDSFCPLTMENFDELFSKVSSKVDKYDLVLPSVSLKMRIALCLRYLFAGDSHRTLEAISHVSRKYTPKIISQMLKHINDILEEEHFKLPNTQDEWTNAANDFEKFWDFPNTLGVLEAKKFTIKSTAETSSRSVVLLSILDAHSRFQYIEIIESEETDSSTAFKNSRLYKSLRTKKLNIPSEKSLKGQTDKTPYFFVGSDVFRNDRHILNAYDETTNLSRSQKAFNFRVNRVRLPAQMAFELIFYKFKIFRRLNDINIDKVKLVIKTCCLLHNYVTQELTKPLDYNEEEIGVQRSAVMSLPKQVYNSYENGGKTRENVCAYCVNEGNIAEQWAKIIKIE